MRQKELKAENRYSRNSKEIKRPPNENLNQFEEKKESACILNADKLKKIIVEMHPKNSRHEKFGVCDNLNRFNFCSCFKDKKEKISDLSKGIGLGPSLFLMATRALGTFFFIMTLVNIPVYLFFYNASEWEAHSPQDYFAKMSIGNMGAVVKSCGSSNLAFLDDVDGGPRQIKLQCEQGVLEDLQMFGLAKDDASTCSAIPGAKDKEKYFIKACHYDSILHDNGIFNPIFETQFWRNYNRTCQGLSECIIPLTFEGIFYPNDPKSVVLPKCPQTEGEEGSEECTSAEGSEESTENIEVASPGEEVDAGTYEAGQVA